MAFATYTDVANRLLRTLTSAEQTAATAVIADVTTQIADEVGRDAAWAAALSPVPGYLKAICIEKAISAIANPSNFASESETLGSYSHSQTYPRATDGGVLLTDDEARRVRAAVYGTGVASPTVGSWLDDFTLDTSEEELPI